MFSSRNDLDTILFQNVLEMGTVITITGEPVQLPDKDNIKKPLGAVFNHSEEI